MKLTTQVKAVAASHAECTGFDAKDALDMSRKSYESMAAQFSVKKKW